MGMQQYLKEIGRGKDGARALTRTQAAELMGWLLDGQAHPLQVGAFCVAMRIKGETAQEMAGFMDALQTRMPQLPPSGTPVVVLPSYNGARRLPVLTPLLALLLVREGLPVLLHGCAYPRLASWYTCTPASCTQAWQICSMPAPPLACAIRRTVWSSTSTRWRPAAHRRWSWAATPTPNTA